MCIPQLSVHLHDYSHGKQNNIFQMCELLVNNVEKWSPSIAQEPELCSPERSKQVLDPSSPARPDSVRVLNRVPMGSRGCPTQPSMLVMDVWPLWSNSGSRQSRQRPRTASTLLEFSKLMHLRDRLLCFNSNKSTF